MATLTCLCLLTLLITIDQSSATVEKQPTLDATNVDLYQTLLGRVEHLEKRDQDQQAEIDTLRSELYAEKQRTSKLEEVIASLLPRDSGASDEDGRVTVDGSNTRREAKKTTDQQSPRIVRRQAEIPVVAFHATMRYSLQHVVMHQSIAFDNVITNIGGAYNQRHGIFVAPVPGVYVFYTNIIGVSNNNLHLEIVRNGTMVAKLFEGNVPGGLAFGQDSAMVVLLLAKGDDVAVQCLDSGKFINGGHTSMFSGFLLHEDVTDATIVG